jgi:toxin YoeB
MKLLFAEQAWQDYLYWQQADKATLKRINELIRDIQRDPFNGIGKPEPLRHQFQDCWSRRISAEHRLLYEVDGDVVFLVQCRYHY